MSDTVRCGLLEDGRILVCAGAQPKAGASWLTPASAREVGEQLVALAAESEKLHPPVLVEETKSVEETKAESPPPSPETTPDPLVSAPESAEGD